MSEVKLLLTAEAAKRLHVHPDTIRRWIKDGYFPNARKLGPTPKSRYAIPEEDIIALERKLQVGSTADN